MQVRWFSWMSKTIAAWKRYHQARKIPTSLAIRVAEQKIDFQVKFQYHQQYFFSKKNTAATTKGKKANATFQRALINISNVLKNGEYKVIFMGLKWLFSFPLFLSPSHLKTLHKNNKIKKTNKIKKQ